MKLRSKASCRLPRRVLRRSAFSLLEIILALAILSGALVVLGELVRLGLRNAEAARDLTRAQLLCESKLAEITSGAMPAEPAAGAPCETDPEWLYSVQLNPTEQTGLIALEVIVYRPDLHGAGPEFRLVRWMQDPAAAPAEELTAEEPAVAAR